jgi:hypothetical protein
MGIDQLEFLIPFAEGNTVWDIYLYIILFFQLILFITVFAGPLRDLMFVAIPMVAALMDKLYFFGFFDPGIVNRGAPAEAGYATTSAWVDAAIFHHTEVSFWTYVARVSLFFFPFVIMTLTKMKRAPVMAGIVGGLSLLYTFGRWLFQQSELVNISALS